MPGNRERVKLIACFAEEYKVHFKIIPPVILGTFKLLVLQL